MARTNTVTDTQRSNTSNVQNPYASAGFPTKTIPPRTYQPFSTSHLETPLWSLVLRLLPLNCLGPFLYQLRQLLAAPMRTNVFPRTMACILPNAIAFTTVGDLVLLVPLLVFFLRGVHYTFVAPALKLSGFMASYCFFMTFITASKCNSPFSFFFGIPYERLISLHRAAALTAAVLSGFHGYVGYKYGDGEESEESEGRALSSDEGGGEEGIWNYLWDGNSNLTGSVLMAATVAMVLLSVFRIIRRFMFNLWYISHIILGITVLVMLFLHKVPFSFVAAIWWAFDAVIRYGVIVPQNMTKAKIRLIGNRKREDMQSYEPAVELVIRKPVGFAYNPGQFVRVAIPAISAVEFHPISISSAPHERNITLHVRRLGDWTDKLVQLAETNTEASIMLEGPYGSSSIGLEDDNKYKLVLFVSGGIGVTPCQSIGKDLLHSHRTQGRNLKELRFVWAVRDLVMVHELPPLLLAQEPDDDYSTDSPEYRRMTERSKSLRQSAGSVNVDSDESSDKAHLARRPAVVQVDIFCTKSSEHVSDNEERRPYNVYLGRPDLDKIFEKLKEEAIVLGERNVAVVGCGPATLMSSLQEACRTHSASVVGCGNRSVFFDMHKEHFEL